MSCCSFQIGLYDVCDSADSGVFPYIVNRTFFLIKAILKGFQGNIKSDLISIFKTVSYWFGRTIYVLSKMKHRKWTPAQKLSIVLEGIKGNFTITELCNRHQISQTQYYKWRDRLLSEGQKFWIKVEINRLSAK